MLQPHQQRVLTEADELQDKITKLKTFTNTPVFNELEPDDRLPLLEQLNCMERYHEILLFRISRF